MGETFVPRPWLEATLHRITPAGPSGADRRVRIVRLEHARALVEVGHRWAAEARAAWNASVVGPSGKAVTLATRRTWGTMRLGKRWLRRGAAPSPQNDPGGRTSSRSP